MPPHLTRRKGIKYYPVWDDIRVPISSAKRLGLTDPDWVKFKDDGAGSVGVYALAFDNVRDEEVFFSVQMPHSYKEGSDIDPHVHWAPSSGAAGDVIWALEYVWADETTGVFGNTTIITITTATAEVSHKHQRAEFAYISGTGKKISSMLMCRLYRFATSASDDYAADVFLLEFDFHFRLDTAGSRREVVK